jgi:hypothetical protein
MTTSITNPKRIFKDYFGKSSIEENMSVSFHHVGMVHAGGEGELMSGEGPDPPSSQHGT